MRGVVERGRSNALFVMRTENSLVGRAEELRKELDATVQDVAGLFAKIGNASCLLFEIMRGMTTFVTCGT